MWLLIKDDQFRDNPPNPGYRPGQTSSIGFCAVYTSDRPEVHEIVAEMRAVIDEYRDRVLIGEIYLPIQQLVTYYGEDLNGAQLPFNFQLLQCRVERRGVGADNLRIYERRFPPAPGRIGCWAITTTRASRPASEKRQARVAAMLLLTLPGTLTIYYGEEMGMADVPIPADQVQDPAEKNEPGLGAGRDPERTPMPWDGSVNAGFTTGRPWLPLNTDYRQRNVSAFEADLSSTLHLYRRLIALRRSCPVLISGSPAGGFCGGHAPALPTGRRALAMDGAPESRRPRPASGCTSRHRRHLNQSAKQGTVVSDMVALDANEGLVLDCRPI